MKKGDQVMVKLQGKSKRPCRILDVAPNRVIVEEIETLAIWSIAPKLIK